MTWDESKHPRVPSGKINGGQFTDKEMGAAVNAATAAAGLGFKGFPPEFKRPEENIPTWEEVVQLVASDLNESPDEIDSDLDLQMKVVQGIVDEAPVSIRVDAPTLAKLIREDGRLKSQFETGGSNGLYRPDYRAQAEKNAFGYLHSMDAEKRPIYGYLSYGSPQVDGYGKFQLVLKDEVKDRTTISYGDSLRGMKHGRQFPAPARRLDLGMFDWDLTGDAYQHATNLGRFGLDEIYYIEAQIHGGVTLADVARIIIYKDMLQRPNSRYDDIIKVIESANIPWTISDELEERNDLGRS